MRLIFDLCTCYFKAETRMSGLTLEGIAVCLASAKQPQLVVCFLALIVWLKNPEMQTQNLR